MSDLQTWQFIVFCVRINMWLWQLLLQFILYHSSVPKNDIFIHHSSEAMAKGILVTVYFYLFPGCLVWMLYVDYRDISLSFLLFFHYSEYSHRSQCLCTVQWRVSVFVCFIFWLVGVQCSSLTQFTSVFSFDRIL